MHTRQVLKDEANQLGLGEMLDYMINGGGNETSLLEGEEQMQR